MNKNIAKPLIIQFTAPETNPVMKKAQKSIFVPVNITWSKFKDNVMPLVEDNAYDSVLIHTRDDVDRDVKGVMSNMMIKVNALSGAGTRAGKPVLAYDNPNEPFYLMNPTKNDMKEAGFYAPSDETIMAKYNGYSSDAAWQEHQDKIWNRMKDMMPLSTKSDKFNRDHAGQLKDPKRGLEDKDLKKFWTFKTKRGLAPTIMGDDMVGMPSVEGRDYEGFTMSNKKDDGTVEVKPLIVRSLMTTGTSGIMIPMANPDGNVNKHQIAADMTAWSTVLHFRAADNRTVAKSQILDKKTKEYNFTFTDGKPTHLKVTDVDPDNTITMQDAKGLFKVQPKKEIINVLKDRNYNIPELITSIKTEQNGKYVWQSPGTMTGSDEVLKTVSPSNPGFIIARPPKNGKDDYVVLVAEGALKGHIVAKYVDVKDKDGACFGDKVAGDHGLIVTQIPGVSEAYIKKSLVIYDKYNITGTYIAMDADGRENRNVAQGIHTAYNYINKINPATVMSWDPEQKGMDDALLAVAQGKLTIKEMGLVTGSPDVLFPLDKAKKMTPYTLKGEQMEQPVWQMEYEESKKVRQEQVAAAQAETAAREAGNQKKAREWVQTPEDITNLQRVTTAKAAEIKEAKEGNLPERKQVSRIEPTPDIDEELDVQEPEEQAPKRSAREMRIREKVINLAQEWDRENPPMNPVTVPDGHKSVYKYQQPVTDFSQPEKRDFRSDTNYNRQGNWGIITVNTEYVMTPQEKGERQTELKEIGLDVIGNMRLTEQTLSLDKEKDLTQDIKDPGLEQ